MADEITVNASMNLSNGAIRVPSNMPNFQADQATARYEKGVQIVGSGSHESLDLGDVSTPGWAMLHNNDTTNFVEFGVDVSGSFHALGQLLPGETAGPFRVASGATVYLQADTAACDVNRVIYAD